jgi:hypothetical protein
MLPILTLDLSLFTGPPLLYRRSIDALDTPPDRAVNYCQR